MVPAPPSTECSSFGSAGSETSRTSILPDCALTTMTRWLSGRWATISAADSPKTPVSWLPTGSSPMAAPGAECVTGLATTAACAGAALVTVARPAMPVAREVHRATPVRVVRAVRRDGREVITRLFLVGGQTTARVPEACEAAVAAR